MARGCEACVILEVPQAVQTRDKHHNLTQKPDSAVANVTKW